MTYYLIFYILFNNHDNWALKILICLQGKGSKAPLAVYESFNMYFIYVFLLNKMQKDDALVPGKWNYLYFVPKQDTLEMLPEGK